MASTLARLAKKETERTLEEVLLLSLDQTAYLERATTGRSEQAQLAL